MSAGYDTYRECLHCKVFASVIHLATGAGKQCSCCLAWKTTANCTHECALAMRLPQNCLCSTQIIMLGSTHTLSAVYRRADFVGHRGSGDALGTAGCGLAISSCGDVAGTVCNAGHTNNASTRCAWFRPKTTCLCVVSAVAMAENKCSTAHSAIAEPMEHLPECNLGVAFSTRPFHLTLARPVQAERLLLLLLLRHTLASGLASSLW